MNNVHGEALIHIEEKIIVAKLIGAFNMEGAIKYTEGMKKTIKEFQGESFLMLVNDLKLEGGTPEAFQELEEYNHWLTTQKLIAKAMVIKSNVTIDLIGKLSPSQELQKYKIFDNEKDAYIWLKSFDVC